jgi:hypothetical protein
MSDIFDGFVFDIDVFDIADGGVVVDPGGPPPDDEVPAIPVTLEDFSYSIRLELNLLNKWEDVTFDWAPSSEPLRFFKGTRQNGPLDSIAETGTMAWTMRNDSRCSGEKAGYYSPNHPNVRPGFELGCGARLVVSFQGDEIIIWSGKVQVIDPTSGRYGDRRTSIIAFDQMATFSERKFSDLEAQISKTETDLIQLLFDSLDESELPPAIDMDAPTEIYPYALHDLGTDGANGRSILHDLVMNARGTAFFKGDGTFRYVNHINRELTIPTFHFDNVMTDLSGPTDLSRVYNAARITSHPKTIPDLEAVELFKYSGSQTIAPGQTIEIFGTYQVQSNVYQLTGATGILVPATVTRDYEFVNDAAANMSSDMVVTFDPFATTVKITITNTHPSDTAHIQKLTVSGFPIFDAGPIITTAYEPKTYGIKRLNVDLKYQNNEQIIQEMANSIVGAYKDFSNKGHADSIEFIPHSRGPFIKDLLTRELGSVVVVSEFQTGATEVRSFLQGMEVSVVEGRFMSATYYLKPRAIIDVQSDDENFCADILEIDEFSDIENRIGYAILGFNEISA